MKKTVRGGLKDLQSQTEWNNMNVTQELLTVHILKKLKKPHLFAKEKNVIVQYTSMLTSNVLSDISAVILF